MRIDHVWRRQSRVKLDPEGMPAKSAAVCVGQEALDIIMGALIEQFSQLLQSSILVNVLTTIYLFSTFGKQELCKQ